MAVLDQYVNSNFNSTTGQINKLIRQVQAAGGVQPRMSRVTFEVAAADSDGSVYRILKGVDPNMVIDKIIVANDAITGGTDWDIGLYQTGIGGAVIDADCFNGAGLDLSTAHATLSSLVALNGFAAQDIAAPEQKLWEWASETVGRHQGSYDICLTANTVGSAAGTVTVEIWHHQG